MKAKLLPMMLNSSSPTRTRTMLTPAFWMASATSREMASPAGAMTSPVKGCTTSSTGIWLKMRSASASFLLYL